MKDIEERVKTWYGHQDKAGDCGSETKSSTCSTTACKINARMVALKSGMRH